MNSKVYEPAEDSYLIQKHLKKYSAQRKLVLDMGTGSGILAISLAKTSKKVFAVDVSDDALNLAKKEAQLHHLNNIQFHHSDLFSFFKNKKIKFDLIVFNPPYLPQDRGITDRAIYGGKHGYETLGRFFSEVNPFLEKDGKILVLFSSLTKKMKVEEAIEKNCLQFKKIGEQKLPFETLFVYLVEKNEVLKKLEGLGIIDVRKHMKGHRGQIYTGQLKKKKVAIKIWRTDIGASNKTSHEAKLYKKLRNKINVPRILFIGKNFFVYDFVPGKFILDYLNDSDKNTTRKILVDVFRQMYVLDKMHISKEEMHHPVKHIVITNEKKPFLLDFERAHETNEPKNVTQFCQFIICGELPHILKEKKFNIQKEKIISAAQAYKKEMSEKHFKQIVGLIQ